MKKFTFQDCTPHELDQGYSGYELEVYAETEACARAEAAAMARPGFVVDLVDVAAC